MTTYEDMRKLIGKCVEIPAHYYTWMQGARFGVVTSVRPAKPGISACICVRMDNPRITKLVRVWRLDVEYCKVLGDVL